MATPTTPTYTIPDITQINLGSYIPKTVFGLSWTLFLDILGILFLVILGLWYFTKRGKLKYHVQLYERDASGIPIPLDIDVLEEKTLNHGKNTMYTLKKYQAQAHPPLSKFIYRRRKALFGTELWCDYLRERQDFIPVQRLVELGVNNTEDMAEFTRQLVEVYKMKPEEARQKYIYSPLIPLSIAKLKYEPMDYNMAEMLQVRLAQREMLYADRQGWLQQYGPMIGIGLAAVAVIVVTYLSYQFASTQISTVTTAANTVANRLGDIAINLKGTATIPNAPVKMAG